MRRYPKRMSKVLAAGGWAFAALMLLLTGCVRNPGDTANLEQRFDTVKVRSREETAARQSMQTQLVPIRILHHTDYVALPDLARATGYHGAWVDHGRAYGMGDHDVIWSFRVGQSTASKAGRSIRMPGQAVIDRGVLYIPAAGVQPLFGSEATIAGDSAKISVLPRPLMQKTGADGSMLNFSDGSKLRSFSVDNSRTNRLLAYAKRYRGVKYEFGAAPYSSSGTFDCSSFTQHVMKTAGIQLPRTANAQSKMGSSVARDALQPGDLLFFNIPGRFKSQAMVGHVGIYMSEGQMIHASPMRNEGVQITDINGPFWKRNFLFAKRVVS